MTEAYIYDHVRSPRGRGKPNGSLHAITPINLASQVLGALRDRNELDTSLIDDVVLGCVAPVGEQGADIARIAVLNADYAENVPGKQLNRFCASGLEAVNTAAAQIMSGQSDVVIGGGVESMSRVPMMSDGGAWATDPQVAYKTYFTPQGVSADLIATKYGISRQDLDIYSAESQKRAAHAWQQGWFSNSIVPIKDHIGRVALDHDEHMRPEATAQSLGELNPSFVMMGEQGGFNSVILHFNVLWRLDEFLKKDRVVAKCLEGLGTGFCKGCFKLFFTADHTHTTATATGSGFEHQRIANTVCLGACYFNCFEFFMAVFDDRNTCRNRVSLGLDLVPQHRHGLRGGSDKDNALFAATGRKLHVFGQETITGMDCIHLVQLRDLDHRFDIQVRLQRFIIRTDLVGFVRLVTMG